MLLTMRKAIASMKGGINIAKPRESKVGVSRLVITSTKEAIIPAAAGTGSPRKSLVPFKRSAGCKSGLVNTLKRASRTPAHKR